MNGTMHPEDAASALSEIRQRQGQVIDAVTIPAWYWWAVAASMVVIGAAVDNRRPVVLGVGITVAVLVIAGLTLGMILGTYRRVRVHDSELLSGRGAVAIVAVVWLVVGITLGLAFGLRALGSALPGTISTIAGGLVLVVAGPMLMRYLRRVMLSRVAGDEAGTGLMR
jgi:hypothetical protein